MQPTTPLSIALYGTNGHQLTQLLKAEAPPGVKVVAVAGGEFPQAVPGVAYHPSLDAILEDPSVELVSLCSPKRAQQATDTIRVLEAGRHVLAEKPAALSEPELDAILSAAQANGRLFREMGGTVFSDPFWAMRELVATGKLGEIVQVFAQKSYPYYPGRAQDEALDGGQLLQSGIHAARMIEHGTHLAITSLEAQESCLGNPAQGELRMAVSFQGRLANGGLATAILNYLNPTGTGRWGNEMLRVFGSKGMAEITESGANSRWFTGETDHGPIPGGNSPKGSYIEMFARQIRTGAPMPLTLEEELSPLRALLRCGRKPVTI